MGVKVDETYYCVLLLSLQLLPSIRQLSGEFIFQEENAPPYKAHQFSENNISQGSAMVLRCSKTF